MEDNRSNLSILDDVHSKICQQLDVLDFLTTALQSEDLAITDKESIAGLHNIIMSCHANLQVVRNDCGIVSNRIAQAPFESEIVIPTNPQN